MFPMGIIKIVNQDNKDYIGLGLSLDIFLNSILYNWAVHHQNSQTHSCIEMAYRTCKYII